MIRRYTRPEMAKVWADDQKYAHWLRVELAVLEAKAIDCSVTAAQLETIKAHAGFTVARIEELDEGPNGFHHDLLAFVETVKETMRAAGVDDATAGLFHVGLTSYDIEDNALVLHLRSAFEPIIAALKQTRETLYGRALEHRLTPMLGLTHGQAAEVITLGVKVLNYVDVLDQHIERIELVLEDLRVGRLSGAVGTYGHLGPQIEAATCAILGLEPVRIATQIINRSRFADLMNSLALLAADIEHIADGLWEMCSYPRMEAREKFGALRRGSSQMPHKRNPNVLERLRGLAKAVRGYQMMLMESIATRDERAIDQSSVERIVWPDATTTVHYMLYQLNRVVGEMEFFPEQMGRNLAATRGMLGAGFVKDALLRHGITSLDYEGESVPTYVFVQQCCFEAWELPDTELMTVLQQRGVCELVPEDELAACFNNDQHLAYVDEIFGRFASPTAMA